MLKVQHGRFTPKVFMITDFNCYLVFKPIAVKLERRTEERLITMNMVLEGISLITKRRLPSFIEETLNSFVANYHDEIRDSNVKPRPDMGAALKG